MTIAIQSAIFTALAGNAGLAARVGQRIYPGGNAPQGVAKPYVTWQEISEVPASSVDGGTPATNTINYRIQINTWASGLDGATTARDVDALVRAAMAAASAFKSLVLDARSLDYEPDTKLYGYSTDFSVWLRT